MKNLNKVVGEKGEILAEKFLRKQKYKILERNYQNKIGEIDIIAKDKDTLVFVEVKTRASCKFGRPCEAVTPYKQNKIRGVASYYLMIKGLSDSDCRFDVVEILDEEINHIKNAF